QRGEVQAGLPGRDAPPAGRAPGHGAPGVGSGRSGTAPERDRTDRGGRQAVAGRRAAPGPFVHRLWRPLQPADGGRHARLRHPPEQGAGRDPGKGRIIKYRGFRPVPGDEPKMSTVSADETKTATDLKIVEDATCTFCGCLCDDITLTVQGDKIT